MTPTDSHGALAQVIGSTEEILDVAVVGGGVAGAYCAWRLLCDSAPTAGKPPRLSLFEGSDRIGGRLLSLKPPGMDRLSCDLGGAYFPNVHPIVCSLVDKLGLSVQPVPRPVRNLFYLRGTRLGHDVSKLPYEFGPGERDCRPEQFLTVAFEKLIPGVSTLRGAALDAALRDAVVDGHPIADWGFWNLLSRAMSAGAFRYTRDSRPDDYMFVNWNAADAIRGLLAFGKDTTVQHLTDGYAALPNTLCDDVRRAGGDIRMRHRLNGITRIDGSDLIRLELARDSVGWGAGGSGDPVTVLARSVILAMPRRSLELVGQSGPLFGEKSVTRMLASVTPIPMFKMFFCYRAPWWQDLGYTSGFAITDLPLRTSFYWGTEGERPGADAGNQNALLMATLSYLQEAEFWAGLQDSASARTRGRVGAPDWRAFAADTSDRLVMEARRQLSEVHGRELPAPYAAASMNWAEDPFGGAVNFWNIHARSEELMAKIVNPVEGLPIYICGESYSRTQGWVEGALESSELLLQKHFALARPSWL